MRISLLYPMLLLSTLFAHCQDTKKKTDVGKGRPTKGPAQTVPANQSLNVQPPPYTPTGIRNTPTAPDDVLVVGDTQDGLFRYDKSDTKTPDNGKTVLVTRQGKRYKRVGNWVNVNQLGVVGDGETNATARLQAAITEACKANDIAKFGTRSPAKGINTVFIPHGYYKITDEIKIPGSVSIVMEQVGSYGGTRIQQVTPGKHLFHIVKDNDNISSAVHFTGGILRGGVKTATGGTALVYGGEGSADANNNSTYFDNVWFQGPEQYAINILRGDDIQIRNCTFDVSAFHSIHLGSTRNKVSNAIVTGCTFYDIRGGVLDLSNVDGLLVTQNRVYTDNAARIPYFIGGSPVAVKRLQVTNNLLDNVNKMIVVNSTAEDVRVSLNQQSGARGRSVEFGGGGVVSNVTVTDNIITGNFSGKVNVGGPVPDAPIFGASTGLTNVRISGNTFRNTGGGSGTTPILLNDNRVKNNRIERNMSTGFSDSGQVANPLLNGFTLVTTVPQIGPVGGMAPNQRIVATRPVAGVQPGDDVTLVDQAGKWSSPKDVKWSALVGEPGMVHVTIENLNNKAVNVPGMNFQLQITRK